MFLLYYLCQKISLYVMIDIYSCLQDEDPETSWLLLSEDDLIALLSQLPFDELFKHLLGMSSKGQIYLYI